MKFTNRLGLAVVSLIATAGLSLTAVGASAEPLDESTPGYDTTAGPHCGEHWHNGAMFWGTCTGKGQKVQISYTMNNRPFHSNHCIPPGDHNLIKRMGGYFVTNAWAYSTTAC